MTDSSKTGTITGIARRTAPRSPMITISASRVTRESGLEGDFRGKPGKRQVTVLCAEAWKAACSEVERLMPWTTRRANLLLEGVSFSAKDVGVQIHIGEVILEITRETDPCSRMDEQQPGLRKALEPDWRGGVCTRVVQDGKIHLGDTATVVR